MRAVSHTSPDARPPRRPGTGVARPLCCLLAGLLLSCRGGGEAGKFKHTGHVTVAKGSCTPCHGTDPAAPERPAPKACKACHAKGAQLHREFQALPKGERIIPRRPGTYADVVFAHGPHAGAGIACDACHALPEGGKQESSYPRMAQCRACHEKNGVAAACPTCHRTRR